MRFYKWTADNKPLCGTGTYNFNEWQRITNPLIMCKQGFHACTAEQLPLWCGTELWEVKLGEQLIINENMACSDGLHFITQLIWDTKDMAAYVEWCDSKSKLPAIHYSSDAAIKYAAAAAWLSARCARLHGDIKLEEQREWIENRIGEQLS